MYHVALHIMLYKLRTKYFVNNPRGIPLYTRKHRINTAPENEFDKHRRFREELF